MTFYQFILNNNDFIPSILSPITDQDLSNFCFSFFYEKGQQMQEKFTIQTKVDTNVKVRILLDNTNPYILEIYFFYYDFSIQNFYTDMYILSIDYKGLKLKHAYARESSVEIFMQSIDEHGKLLKNCDVFKKFKRKY